MGKARFFRLRHEQARGKLAYVHCDFSGRGSDRHSQHSILDGAGAIRHVWAGFGAGVLGSNVGHMESVFVRWIFLIRASLRAVGLKSLAVWQVGQQEL